MLESQFIAAWPADMWRDVTCLAAVSGGPDSVALLRAMVRLRTTSAAGRIIVAHYNHRWRGAESDGDEAFVRKLAADLGLEIEVGHAERPLTSEGAARNERYAFLLAAAHRAGARFVAAGHTADDQAETILFRMLRGTGLSGLTGMPQTRQLSDATTLIRPLLSVRRAEILNYLAERQQCYRIDGSNADLRFARNRLRHEVLPSLQELSAGDVVENLLQLGRQAAEIVEPIRGEASRLLDQLAEVQGTSVVLRLDGLSETPQRPVLREMFVEVWRRRGWPRGEMTSQRWEELAEAFAAAAPARRMFPGGVQLRVLGRNLHLQQSFPSTRH
jgi:tRNA(Ile)-lysidine synthase